MKYRKTRLKFLGIELFPIFNISLFAWLIFSIIWLIYQPPFYLYFCLSLLAIILGLIIFNIGSIKYYENGKGKFVSIYTHLDTVTLQTPISYKQYWTYDFGGSMRSFYSSDASEDRFVAANNVVSILLLTDSNGQTTMLKEKIFLDGRFPNEAQYIAKEPENILHHFNVQRTDKILKKIEWMLGPKN